jgi:hypothetical protein
MKASEGVTSGNKPPMDELLYSFWHVDEAVHKERRLICLANPNAS